MLIKQIKLIEKPLKEHLKRQHKLIETQRRTTKKKKIIEIGLDKFIKDGWYTRQAIAELLTALDFVE